MNRHVQRSQELMVKMHRVEEGEDGDSDGVADGGVQSGSGASDSDEGQPLTTTYMDYLVPTFTDVPPIDVISIETPSPFTVGGIKGMGEGGQIAAPAAVANAVADALAPFGARVEKLPLTPDYVLRMIGKIGSAASAAGA